MEQQLIDALEKVKKPEDLDEVSMMMIMTRVTSALREVREVTAEYLNRVKQIYAEKEMELKLGGVALVLNVTDFIVDLKTKEPIQMCVLGSGSKVLSNIQQITEQLHV